MTENDTIILRPIGIIHTPHAQAQGAPIQPRSAQGVEGTIQLDPGLVPALADLEGFERIWLIYFFHRVGPAQLTVTPYMDDTPRGVLATRAPCRPNPIGMSCVRLLAVEGPTLRVADVDMLDGTPLLDIKPYAPRMDVYDVERIGWLAGKDPTGRSADTRFHQPPPA